ncbi:MAG: hypothetical protein GX621_04255 [Pirellulaceae bacterium]|nr:hypothetical protein [Pirellulaceae bacterium]
MDRIIRRRRSYAVLMAVSTLMFLMLTVGLLVPHQNSPANTGELSSPRSGALFVLVGFGVFMAGAFAIEYIRCLRHSLGLGTSGFDWRGVFGRRHFELADVSRVDWRPDGLIVVAGDRRARIEIGQYHDDDAADVIRYFRLRFPFESQSGWDAFRKSKWRVVDRQKAIGPSFDAECEADCRAFRRRIDFWVGLCGLIALAVGILVFGATGDSRVSFAPMCILLLWPVRFLRDLYPIRRGPIDRWATQQTPPRPERKPKWRSICLLAACFGLMFFGIATVHDPALRWLEWPLIVATVGIFIVFLVTLHRDVRPAEKWLAEWNKKAAEEAQRVYLGS